MACGYELQKGEHILRADLQPNYTNINDILELYQLKKYIDNEIYLLSWTQDDINDFKQKVSSYGTIIGKFMSSITSENFKSTFQSISFDYKSSFWEIINDYGLFKNITKEDLLSVLNDKPFLINEILQHKKIVEHFNTTIKDFLLSHPETAELLLTIYEVKDDDQKDKYYLPKSLTVNDKETIIINYLDSPKVNINYIPIIQNARSRDSFKISNKTRLKAKQVYQSENEKFFEHAAKIHYGVSVSFPENMSEIKDGKIKDGFNIEYTYNLEFIKANNSPYALFENFYYLFEYIDHQHRIRLINKLNTMDILERVIGVHSTSEYITGTGFNLSEMTSAVQIAAYMQLLEKLGVSLETILSQVFCFVLHEKYGFADNARLSMPTSTSYLEKVRSLAPEFESMLKQYKLFVEEGHIDFELLQISSNPTSIKDIPSLNKNKYIYINNDNLELSNIIRLFFSDQTLLGYVEPYRNKHYRTLFDVLVNEDVAFDRYEDFQKPELNHLIEKGYLYIDDNGYLQFVNPARVTILYDLFQNEVGAFHHYPRRFQQEAEKMVSENLLYMDSTLFSKPEQDYFNFYLNKSEFTNGYDLRNKYVHGSQANPIETEKHKSAYQSYLRLIVLTLLKIEDDLMIHKYINTTNDGTKGVTQDVPQGVTQVVTQDVTQDAPQGVTQEISMETV